MHMKAAFELGLIGQRGVVVLLEAVRFATRAHRPSAFAPPTALPSPLTRRTRHAPDSLTLSCRPTPLLVLARPDRSVARRWTRS